MQVVTGCGPLFSLVKVAILLNPAIISVVLHCNLSGILKLNDIPADITTVQKCTFLCNYFPGDSILLIQVSKYAI